MIFRRGDRVWRVRTIAKLYSGGYRAQVGIEHCEAFAKTLIVWESLTLFTRAHNAETFATVNAFLIIPNYEC